MQRTIAIIEWLLPWLFYAVLASIALALSWQQITRMRFFSPSSLSTSITPNSLPASALFSSTAENSIQKMKSGGFCIVNGILAPVESCSVFLWFRPLWHT